MLADRITSQAEEPRGAEREGHSVTRRTTLGRCVLKRAKSVIKGTFVGLTDAGKQGDAEDTPVEMEGVPPAGYLGHPCLYLSSAHVSW